MPGVIVSRAWHSTKRRISNKGASSNSSKRERENAYALDKSPSYSVFLHLESPSHTWIRFSRATNDAPRGRSIVRRRSTQCSAGRPQRQWQHHDGCHDLWRSLVNPTTSHQEQGIGSASHRRLEVGTFCLNHCKYCPHWAHYRDSERVYTNLLIGTRSKHSQYFRLVFVSWHSCSKWYCWA
jgi:hypothetical protein